jgi:hypothetical protein
VINIVDNQIPSIESRDEHQTELCHF